MPGNKEDEHNPKGPYPGTHYGKKVDELNACIKAQDFNGISRVSKELEGIKRDAQHRTPYEISKDQRERDRKIEGAPHEPKISPSEQKKLGEPDSKIKEQAHGKTTDSLDTKGEVNPTPAIDSVKGTPDKLGNPESMIDLRKTLRSCFTGVEGQEKKEKCEDCGKGIINRCELEECLAIGENLATNCIYDSVSGKCTEGVGLPEAKLDPKANNKNLLGNLTQYDKIIKEASLYYNKPD